MSNRIHVLPPEVFNKIAAGEVVERAACAVKEVVENSIDAGATKITIEVNNGGLDLIRVTDNGCGIYEEDLPYVFLSHATSKLESESDLLLIQTLGFRGEALASIASISEIKLTTRTSQSDTAVQVTAVAGNITDKVYVSANVGTTIEITNLYKNVPARMKYLKSSKGESSEISKCIARMILTNPSLQIKYFLDGKLVYQTNGTGLQEAIYTVYNAETLSHLIPVNFEDNDIRIIGYISPADYYKANRSYQTISINGRQVSDVNIQAAIMQAYKAYYMAKQFPMYVLDISVPFYLVDVNVHPRKENVRFATNSGIAGRCFVAVKKALEANTASKSQNLWNGANELNSDENNVQEEIAYDFGGTLYAHVSQMTAAQAESVLDIEDRTRRENRQTLEEFADEMERTLSVRSARIAYGFDKPDELNQPLPTVEPPTQQPNPIVVEQEPPKPDLGDELLSRTRILGTAFKTHLTLTVDDKYVMIDQHAAHERILFDKFMANGAGYMQQVLFPYVFTVSESEAEFLQNNLENILKAGIEMEVFGTNTFRINAVSTLLEDMEMQDFVQYMLNGMEEFRQNDNSLIVEKIAQKACKAAVKAGETLSESEIKFILKSIYENKVLQCPHGRPITVVYTRAQLEKMFKRTV